MKKTAILLISVLAAISCKYDEARLTAPVELGAVPVTVNMPTSGGDVDIPFYANLQGTISLLDDSPWATLGSTSFSGDGSLRVSVAANDGIRRYARVLFSADNVARRDTVTIRQDGITDTLTVSSTSVIVYNRMGDTSIPASMRTEMLHFTTP